MHAHRHCSKGDGKIDSTAFQCSCVWQIHIEDVHHASGLTWSRPLPLPVDVVHLGLAMHVCCAPCLVASLASSVDSM